jgi:hypothetical protein
MSFAKEARVKDPAYLRWCRVQRCAFCDRHGGEAHHVGGKGMGGARLRDDLAVPACRKCHMRCEGLVVAEKSGQRLGPIGRPRQLRKARAARDRYLRELAAPAGAIPW